MPGLLGDGASVINSVEKSVNSFGRFSELLHMNLDAVHMSFSSFLQLLTNVSMIRHEFGAIFSEAIGLRTLWYIYKKLKEMLYRLYSYLVHGQQETDLEFAFSKAQKSSKNQKVGWMSTAFMILIGLWLVRRILWRMMHPSTSNQIPQGPHQPQGGFQPHPHGFSSAWNNQGYPGPPY